MYYDRGGEWWLKIHVEHTFMSNTIIIMHAHMESVNLFKRETFCQQANKNAPACMYCSLQLASFLPFLNSGTTRIVSSARPIFSNCTQKNNKNKKRAGSNFLNSFFFIQRLLYFKCEAEAASTLSKGCRRRKSGFTYQSYILLFSTLFENYPKCLIWIRPEVLSTRIVKVARFARNFEWDFFCDFHAPCFSYKYYCRA